ncbi:YaiO family outer membrane beta-barrel protein [Bacteroidota bacterium]
MGKSKKSRISIKIIVSEKMNIRITTICFTVFLFIMLSLNSILLAQLEGDVDDRFREARELAFAGEREEAINLCKRILLYYPEYNDVRVFLGRIFAWEKRYDDARYSIGKVLEKGYHYEAVSALADVELWSKNYDSALDYCNMGLRVTTNDEDLLYKKARILKALGNLEEAGIVIDNLLQINPSFPRAAEMKDLLDIAVKNNKLSLNYSVDIFNENFDPWHLIYLEYSRKEAVGSFFARLNYASRFEKNGYQVESDAYISIREGTYSYFNIGYSPSELFPEFRFGIEPYQKLPASFEFSIGYRFLKFDTQNVSIFTGHLGKYLGNYWLSIRPFITPKSEGTNFSGVFILRRYFKNVDNNISFEASMGFVPSSELNENEVLQIDSRKIGVGYNGNLSKNIFIRISVKYFEEEYYPRKWRKGADLQTGLKWRF